ncbi:hypothetical protein [Bacillus suaedaesalsae]|uniref:Uncharacterized protein n=1 Tax=Bacillus suaedaesalsae TaxID=2810349 RepID=A0ABS2DG14_9BACI|nr:hypothetical protein [Bacillus suaedaesalsae]MBM6617422.1 hypothetical protein [Bacillus suaedaesalsae]
MSERIGKLLIGFVVVAIFIGVAESSTQYAKMHNKLKEEATHQIHENEYIL